MECLARLSVVILVTWRAVFEETYEPIFASGSALLAHVVLSVVFWIPLGFWIRYFVSLRWEVQATELWGCLLYVSGCLLVMILINPNSSSVAKFIFLTPFALVLSALFVPFLVFSTVTLFVIELVQLGLSTLFYCIARLISAMVAGSFAIGLLVMAPNYIWSKLFVLCPPQYRKPGPLCVDECGSRRGALCGTCSTLVRSSALITGTPRLFTSPIEKHQHHTAVGLLSSAKQCHLCNLLLISVPRQNAREENDASSGLLVDGQLGFTQYGTNEDTDSSDPNSGGLVIVYRSQKLGCRSKLYIERVNKPQQDVRLAIQQNANWGLTATYDLPCQATSLCKKTDSSVCMSRARGWIESCLKKHSSCRRAMPHTDDSFWPSRLVKVSSIGLKHVSVIETVSESGPFHYLALSHCWGKERIFTLTDDNVNQMKVAIPFDKLPTNFKDAIKITADLGYEYIWIDSLCILQGNEHDWAKESAQMGRIYANAICTISATASDSAGGGCFFDRDPLMGDCIVGTQLFSSLVVKSPMTSHNGLDDLFQEKIENAPVTRRGWIFQERALSKRVLHFSDGLILFECNTLLATEYHSDGIPHEKSKIVLDMRTYRRIQHYVQHTLSYAIAFLIYGISMIINLVAYPVSIVDNIARIALSGFDTTAIETNLMLSLVDHLGDRSFRIEDIDFWAAVGTPELPEIQTSEWPQPSEADDERILPGFVGMRRAFQAATNHPREQWDEVERVEFHQQWMELVESYSGRLLTNHQDRLVAIVGVATFIQESIERRFLAGLWEGTLGWNLLWRCERPDWERKVRPVPTWSWASVEGKVTHEFTPDTTSARSTDAIKRTLDHIQFLVNTKSWTVNVLQQTENMVYNASLTVDRCQLVPFEGSSVNFHPDLRTDLPDSSLFLLPVVQLERSDRSEVHGIVVHRVDALQNHNNTFERAGYFSSDTLIDLSEIDPLAIYLQ